MNSSYFVRQKYSTSYKIVQMSSLNPPESPGDAAFWSHRYQQKQTGWDVGYPTPPLREYFDQLDGKDQTILIPGAGNAYEAEYLWGNGFRRVFVADIAKEPLNAFAARLPDFPTDQLLHGDFFALEGQYDLIVEQTFFCSFYPSKENRSRYAEQVFRLLKPGGKLVGLWFSFPLDPDRGRPPYGGTKQEYESYLSPWLKMVSFAPAHNSIPERMGNELFGIWQKPMDRSK